MEQCKFQTGPLLKRYQPVNPTRASFDSSAKSIISELPILSFVHHNSIVGYAQTNRITSYALPQNSRPPVRYIRSLPNSLMKRSISAFLSAVLESPFLLGKLHRMKIAIPSVANTRIFTVSLADLPIRSVRARYYSWETSWQSVER